MSEIKFSPTNISFYRRLNPAIKFIIFILSIVFIFVPSGFFGQIVLLIFLVFVSFLAKLPKKVVFGIIKTAIIMFTIFAAINWITYKVPIAFDTLGNIDYKVISQSSIFGPIWQNNQYADSVYISNLWGGDIYGKVDKDLIDKFINDNTTNIGKVNEWFDNINIKDELLNKINIPLITEINDKKVALYLMNNDFSIAGVKYDFIAIKNINPDFLFKNYVINPNAIVIFSKTWSTYSPLGLVLALNITLKVSLIIISASLLTFTTSSIELTNGLESLLSPLRIFKFPVSECSMILAIAIRFIPSLLGESKRILNAQAARGMDFNNGNLIVKIKSLVSLIVPLFSIAFKKSDDLANAMDARGYNPRRSRTQYRVYKLSILDYVYLFLVTLIGLFVSLSLNLFHFYFGFLGIFEGALIF